MPSGKDPRPTDNLGDVAAWPFEDGVDEITIRVTNYADDGVTPSSFQAICKRRDRTKIWGVGIRSNPVAALSRAISEVYERAEDGWPGGGEVGHSREVVLMGAAAFEVGTANRMAEDGEEDDEIEALLG